MRRALLLATLVLLAAPAAAGAATVKLAECVPALEAADRTATFEARARAAGGGGRVQVRFTLQVREGDLVGWRRVVAPGFDTWLSSDPGVRRYSYARTIENLAAPAAYRTVVRFRWLDEEGEVADRTRVTSPVCRQPDLRPDLEPRRIELAPGPTEDSFRYVVTLVNSGRTAAGPFDVALSTGAPALEPLPVPGLGPGEETTVTFVAPACTDGAPLAATADAEDAVDERDEADNVRATRCRP